MVDKSVKIVEDSVTKEIKVLVFTVGKSEYALDIMQIKEILELEKVTKLPLSEPKVAGMTLIRGDVVTLIDLREVLEKEVYEDYKNKSILLCEITDKLLGFIVEEVKGIHTIQSTNITPLSKILGNLDVVSGNIMIEDHIVLMLDIEKAA